jgi:hypothetical protein
MQTGPRENVPKMPNTKAYSVSVEDIKNAYGERYVLLRERPEYAEVMRVADPLAIPAHLRQFTPQDHP